MVIVRNIHQYSLCSSCLVPFKVCCHIAYISSGYRVVGLSKLARITDMFSRRLQNPQNLADQICKGLSDAIQPKGVAVILQSWHLPLSYCGHVGHSLDSAFQHAIITYSGRGQFEDKGNSAWDYLLALLRLEGVSIPRTGTAECNFVREEWCPCVNLHVVTAKEGCITSGLQKDYGNFESINGNINRSTSNGESTASKMLEYSVLTLGESFSLMVSAVEIILESLVTGMVKEDLHQTAIYYTKWLLQFRRGHEESLYKLSMKMENVMEWQVPRDNVIMDTLRNGLSIVNMVSNGSRLLKPNEGALGGVLAQLDVPFCSLCEHHLLPFFGKGHIGYLASDAGSQDVSRDTVMEMIGALGHKLQVQERLTKQIAEAIAYRFSLSSIIVVLEASHVCMLSRGVEKLGSSTATDAVLGCFATDYTVKAHFLEMVMRNREVKRATSVL
ncbi:hypothetical protein KP509_16G063000 [Ceratopteris richardii]|nr:hypothetical protein KP509_16G063000 [Ceratopteris richardii]